LIHYKSLLFNSWSCRNITDSVKYNMNKVDLKNTVLLD